MNLLIGRVADPCDEGLGGIEISLNAKQSYVATLVTDEKGLFEIPENIYLTALNYDTGAKAAAGEKNVITEALKLEDINNIDNKNLISTNGRDKTIKFRQFY